MERKREVDFRPFLPSKLVELDHDKSKKSLAEIYEEEFVNQVTGNVTNKKDEALKKEHQEIDDIFEELCHKLNALSNFHYTPKMVRIMYINKDCFRDPNISGNCSNFYSSPNLKSLLLPMCPPSRWKKSSRLMLVTRHYWHLRKFMIRRRAMSR